MGQGWAVGDHAAGSAQKALTVWTVETPSGRLEKKLYTRSNAARGRRSISKCPYFLPDGSCYTATEDVGLMLCETMNVPHHLDRSLNERAATTAACCRWMTRRDRRTSSPMIAGNRRTARLPALCPGLDGRLQQKAFPEAGTAHEGAGTIRSYFQPRSQLVCPDGDDAWQSAAQHRPQGGWDVDRRVAVGGRGAAVQAGR